MFKWEKKKTQQSGSVVQRKSSPKSGFALEDNRPQMLQLQKQQQKDTSNSPNSPTQLRDNRSQITKVHSELNTYKSSNYPAPIQRKWNQKDNDYIWDTLIDGVQWYADEQGDMWFHIIEPSLVKKGNIVDYKSLKNEKKHGRSGMKLA